MLVDTDVCFAYVISKKNWREIAEKYRAMFFFIELEVMKQKNGY